MTRRPGPRCERIRNPAGNAEQTAEAIRLELAAAWGEMGAAWGVTPAIARVQAYLMARQEPLTEREVREALGLSPSRRQPGPCRSRVVGHRRACPGAATRRPARARPASPISRSATTGSGSGGSSPSARSARATRSSRSSRRRSARRPRPLAANPDDRELAALRDWLGGIPRLRPALRPRGRPRPQLEPRELERSLQFLGRVPDATILRLFDLLGGLADDDVLGLVDALSRLSPTAARRATKLMSGVVRTVAR